MTSNIEELLKENQVTLLQGAAGAEKSSVKALKGWAAEEKMKEATCCLLSLCLELDFLAKYKSIFDFFYIKRIF